MDNAVDGNTIDSEICQGNSFEPRCSDNEIIVIKSSQFGRKKYGQCLSDGIGPIGCYEDVTDYVDTVCFGQNECSLFVPDRHLSASNPCSNPSDYSAYLEVSYECAPGM